MVELFDFECKDVHCNNGKCNGLIDNSKSINNIINFSNVHYFHKKKSKRLVNDLSLKFEIPVYQRKYCWTEENISTFIKTLVKSGENNSHNFLGSLWFNYSKKIIIIIIKY